MPKEICQNALIHMQRCAHHVHIFGRPFSVYQYTWHKSGHKKFSSLAIEDIGTLHVCHALVHNQLLLFKDRHGVIPFTFRIWILRIELWRRSTIHFPSPWIANPRKSSSTKILAIGGRGPWHGVFRLRQSVFPSHILPFNFSVTNSCKNCQIFGYAREACSSYLSAVAGHSAWQGKACHEPTKRHGSCCGRPSCAFCKPERNLAQAQGWTFLPSCQLPLQSITVRSKPFWCWGLQNNETNHVNLIYLMILDVWFL